MKTTAKKTARATNHSTEETTMKKSAPQTTETATSTSQETAMKKTAKKTATIPADASASTSTTSSDVPLQLQALEQSCGYGDPFPNDARKASLKVVRAVPSTIVERVIALAVRGGGVVAGIAFDPDAAKAALAEADEADEVATAAQMLGRRAQDQSIRLRAGISTNVSGIRTAMRGYVKTTQGASMAQESEELRTLANQHAAAAKARRTRAKNEAEAASSSGTTETPASTGTPAPTPTPTTGSKAS